jgi:hypothetical protein
MTRLLLPLIALLSSFSVIAAPFSMDVKKSTVFNELDHIMLKDLAVGDSAYVEQWDALCKDKKGLIGFPSETLIQTNRNKFSVYYLLRMEPKHAVSIQAVVSDQPPKQNSKSLLTHLMQIPHCSHLAKSGIIQKTKILSLKHIEGATSLKQLLQRYQNLNSLRKKTSP